MLPHLISPQTEIYEPVNEGEEKRLKNLFKTWDGGDADVGLIGVPFDYGIIAGGGRPGAKQGPDAIRQAIKRFGGSYFIEHDINISELSLVDCGDIDVVADDLLATHARLTEIVKSLLERSILPIILGGGHDLSFATIRALVEHSTTPIGGINVDAHLDVRPVVNNIISSGTPFWRALETFPDRFLADRFVEMGMVGNSNAQTHCDYILNKGVSLTTLDKLRLDGVSDVFRAALDVAGDDAFFSIDIDVVQQAFAPGCSAPAPLGVTPEEITAMAFYAGQAPSIKLFDLMEVSPPYDQDGRTARLAAAIIGYFLAGFVTRKSR